MLSRRNPDLVETSSRGSHVPETLSVRPVVTILVSLVNAIGITGGDDLSLVGQRHWYNFGILYPSDQPDFDIKFLC